MSEVGTTINRIIKMPFPQPRYTATNLEAFFPLRFNVKISNKNTKVQLGRGLNIICSTGKEVPYQVNLRSIEAIIMKINHCQNFTPVQNGSSNTPPRDKNSIFKIGQPRKHRTYGNQDSTSTWQLQPVSRSRGRNTKPPTREPTLKSMENLTLKTVNLLEAQNLPVTGYAPNHIPHPTTFKIVRETNAPAIPGENLEFLL